MKARNRIQTRGRTLIIIPKLNPILSAINPTVFLMMVAPSVPEAIIRMNIVLENRSRTRV
ncbi:MAG TPA: hypothetical protein ENI15_10800 [Spirochaetes bacterium]|nr:hypothetical protein [Spirochaetota bacterium]